MFWVLIWLFLLITLTIVFSIYILIAWVLDSMWVYILAAVIVIVAVICCYYFFKGVNEVWDENDK